MDVMQENMKQKRNRQIKKFGKPSTFRSEKPKMKKKKVEKFIDAETQDQLTYLQMDLKSLEETQLAAEKE